MIVDRSLIVESLEKILREILGEGVQISADSTAADFEGWDSLNHIQIMVAIERTFEVRFTVNEFRGIASLGDLMNTIESKLLAKTAS